MLLVADLPQPDLLDHPDPLGGGSPEQLLRAARLCADRGWCDRERADRGHRLDPGLRRGHRLRPAPGRPLPRGAAPHTRARTRRCDSRSPARRPAIIASGRHRHRWRCWPCTLAEVNSTRWARPALGGGRSDWRWSRSLTLLPALLLIGGRRAFWPFVPHPGDAGTDATHGRWRRLGDRIAQTAARDLDRQPRRPPRYLRPGWLTFSTDLTTADSFRGKPEAVARTAADLTVIPRRIQRANRRHRPRPCARRRRDKQPRRACPGSRRSSPRTEQGPPGTKLSVTLEADPYSTARRSTVMPTRIRTAVKPRRRQRRRQVGGPHRRRTATCATRASARDNQLSSSR